MTAVKDLITDVTFSQTTQPDEHLLAYVSVTFAGLFAIRDVKIISGPKGIFVCMPNREKTDRCPKCKMKNRYRSRYCNQCGDRLSDGRAPVDVRGRLSLYEDIFFPINHDGRKQLSDVILSAYNEWKLGSPPVEIADVPAE